MGSSNFKRSLEKRYSALTGELDHTRASIKRIQREVAELPVLEARVAELENLIEGATMLLKNAHPNWTPEQSPTLRPWSHTRLHLRFCAV